MPPVLSAIDNEGSNFCAHSAKFSEGHLLYSMDVMLKRKNSKAQFDSGTY